MPILSNNRAENHKYNSLSGQSSIDNVLLNSSQINEKTHDEVNTGVIDLEMPMDVSESPELHEHYKETN